MTQTIQLEDGSALELHELGDPDGFPIVFHHGTPGSGTLYERWATPGVRLIAYDRAGYGGSTRKPGRAVVDVVADIRRSPTRSALERFATWGLSGGGPHALACAALCDERLVAAAQLAGVGPWDAEGLDWLAGMGEGQPRGVRPRARGRGGAPPGDRADAQRMLAATRRAAARGDGAAPRARPTAAALTGDSPSTSTANMTHALADGADGWIDDNLAFVEPWGFDVDGDRTGRCSSSRAATT